MNLKDLALKEPKLAFVIYTNRFINNISIPYYKELTEDEKFDLLHDTTNLDFEHMRWNSALPNFSGLLSVTMPRQGIYGIFIGIIDVKGGHEGAGEYAHIVFAIFDEVTQQPFAYLKAEGSYQSWADTTWIECAEELQVVKPVEKLVTFYIGENDEL